MSRCDFDGWSDVIGEVGPRSEMYLLYTVHAFDVQKGFKSKGGVWLLL